MGKDNRIFEYRMEHHKNFFKKEKFNLKADIEIVNSEIEFKDCIFEGRGRIKIKNSKIVFTNCRFFIGISLHSSICAITSCSFSRIDTSALSIKDNSQCSVDNCSFLKNGSHDLQDAQIFIVNSVFNISSSTIKDGIDASGIEAVNSKIHISSTFIINNSGCGIALELCVFEIVKIKMDENGSKEGDFAQILINSSKGIIRKSKICNGINSNGIAAEKESSVELADSKLFGHIKNGIAIQRLSELFVKGCRIYKNGSDYEGTLQIWVDNSKLTAKESIVTDGCCGIYGQKNSYIDISRCSISNNAGGICLFESSELKISDSFISYNVFKPQLWLEGSKAWILNSTVLAENSKSKTIHAENMSVLQAENLTISNPEESISIENSKNVSMNLSSKKNWNHYN